MTDVSFRAMLAALAFLSLGACSSGPIGAVTGVFGGGEEEKKGEENAPEKEDRISILALEETLEADPRFAGADVPLPPAYKNVSWPQPGGEADHTLHHLQATGNLKVAWKADIGSGGEREILTAPPVVADGLLYIMDSEARVSAYDVATGERKWRAELTPKIKEKFRVREVFARPDAGQIGFGGGVAYDNGKLFVTSGFGFAAALKADTGEEIWRTETDAPVRTPPTAYRGALYFVTNTNEFIALDQETGDDKWKYQSFEEAARILSSSSPAAAGDLVVAPFSSGELVAFLADSGRPVWNETLARNARLTSLSTLNDIAGSPVIDRGLIYVVSHAGQLAAIDIRTGGRIWEVPVASLQTPWVAGNFIFLVSVDAELACIERESGAIVWVSQLRRFESEKKRKGRIAWSGPIAAGDHLILANTRGEVVKVSPQDGSIVEKEEVGDSFIVPPIVAEETIFVLSDTGKLSALR
jgi:outer membrane protein assembly factor BamB